MKKLTRPKKGRKIAGVCIGLANYLNIDPTVVRLAFLFFALPGGLPGIFIYFVLWIVVPEE